MSFPRHGEIFPSDGGASPAANAPAHRLDEFPAGYSSAGCSPALPASASPAGHQYAVMSSCRSSTFHRTANCVLTVCVSRGGKRTNARSCLSGRCYRLTRISTAPKCGMKYPSPTGGKNCLRGPSLSGRDDSFSAAKALSLTWFLARERIHIDSSESSCCVVPTKST